MINFFMIFLHIYIYIYLYPCYDMAINKVILLICWYNCLSLFVIFGMDNITIVFLRMFVFINLGNIDVVSASALCQICKTMYNLGFLCALVLSLSLFLVECKICSFMIFSQPKHLKYDLLIHLPLFRTKLFIF